MDVKESATRFCTQHPFESHIYSFTLSSSVIQALLQAEKMYFTSEMMDEVENQQRILYDLIEKATKAYRRMGEVNFADEEARRIVYAVGKTIYDCGKGFGDAGAVIREISYLPQSVGSSQKNNRDSSPPPHDELRIVRLNEDKRVHTGEKPFVCHFNGCNKKYTTKRQYTKGSHSGEK